MLQIPSRLPREYESPSPDHRTRDTVVVTLFSDTITCCTFINVFVTESVIPWYAHPDSQKRFHMHKTLSLLQKVTLLRRQQSDLDKLSFEKRTAQTEHH